MKFKTIINLSLMFFLVLGLFGLTISFGNGINNQLDQEKKIDITSVVEWQTEYGGIQQDVPREIIQTSDGGYLILSNTRSFGVHDWSIWILKLDNSGNEVWSQLFEGIQPSFGKYSLVETEDGYTLLGEFLGCCWIIKTDLDGNLLWNKSIPNTINYFEFNATTRIKSIISTKDGGYLYYGEHGARGVYTDVLIGKLDSSGNEVWNKTYEEPEYNSPRQVIELANGGYLISGATIQSNGTDVSWFEKTDRNGDILWKHSIEESESIVLTSITETTDHGLLVAFINSQKSLNSDYDKKLCSIKYDSFGNKLWDLCFTSSGISETFIGIEKLNGGYLFTGSSNQTSSINKTDVWLISTDKNGKILWDTILSEKDTQIPYSAKGTIDGGIIVLAWTKKTPETGDLSLYKVFINESVDETTPGYLIGPAIASFIVTRVIKNRKKKIK